jgi:hypothetical protein
MSHRQKNEHKSRHHTHAKKSDSLYKPKAEADPLEAASPIIKRLTPGKSSVPINVHAIVAPM